MDPPWPYRPDYPAGSVGWRMGPGKDDWMDDRAWLRAPPQSAREE